MWELDCKERWVQKNWCFWTVVLEKTLESPLNCKKVQPVHPKGDQSWVFIGKTDAEAETPILWPPQGKSWLIGKDSDAGRDWGQEEKETTEDEMAWWYHRLDACEFGWMELVMDREAWRAVIHGVAKSRTWLSNWTDWTVSLCVGFPGLSSKESACQCRRCEFDPWVRKIPLEKEMATHSSIIAWKIPQTVQPCKLHSRWFQKSQTWLSDQVTTTKSVHRFSSLNVDVPMLQHYLLKILSLPHYVAFVPLSKIN